MYVHCFGCSFIYLGGDVFISIAYRRRFIAIGNYDQQLASLTPVVEKDGESTFSVMMMCWGLGNRLGPTATLPDSKTDPV
jgi:hypothetical protein